MRKITLSKIPLPKIPLSMLCGAIIALGVAGCDRDRTDETATPPADTAATTPAAPTPPPADTMPAAPGALTLATAPVGSHVADNTGRALYVLEGDDTGTKCTGECLQAWPPLLAPATAPTAGSSSLQTAMVGTIQRSDGATQVTYNGHPLYHYAKDTGAGMTSGHDVTDQWGEWSLIGPSGTPMEDDDTATTPTTEPATGAMREQDDKDTPSGY